jgi:RNA polymerase sigma-70 factor (ECF subfamily)
MMWLLWALASQVGLSGERRPADATQVADLEALRRIADGERDQLVVLYDHHARAVHSLALRMLGSQADAEEITQEVFVQAWRQATRYDASRGTVIAWLLMITRSRAIDRLRGRPPIADKPADEGVVKWLAESSDGPEAQAVTAEQVERVRRALASLPRLQRVAIELAFYEGLTHNDVAAQLEQPLGTIKTRIRLGLLKLRDAMRDDRT